MSRIWLELFLGKIGNYLIDFFAKYYIWVIPFILAYGIFMGLASYNLRRIEKKINYEIINQTKYLLRRNPKSNFISVVENIVINWEDMVKFYSFFPYVANEFDLWVTHATPVKVRELIMGDENRIRLVLERRNIFFEGDRGSIRKNLYLDYTNKIFRQK
ncbi:MAG: hypothetical protein M1308_15730 [Actinobacteria bacterium]|nr:hypothetical protein [Actinomycetota bacterium]